MKRSLLLVTAVILAASAVVVFSPINDSGNPSGHRHNRGRVTPGAVEDSEVGSTQSSIDVSSPAVPNASRSAQRRSSNLAQPLKDAKEGGNRVITGRFGSSSENLAITPEVPRADAYQAPSLAKNPTMAGRMAMAFQNGADLRTCFLAITSDSGETWAVTPLIGRGGQFPTPSAQPQCLTPTVAFGPEGNLYYAYQVRSASPGNVNDDVLITISGDGGTTFSPPKLVDATEGEQNYGRCTENSIKNCDYAPVVATDLSTRRVYVTWTRFCNLCVPLSQIMIASSADGGQTFTPPVGVSPLTHTAALLSSVAVGPDERAHVVWADWSAFYTTGFTAPLTIFVASSADGGRTFAERSAIGDISPTCPQARCSYLWWFPSEALTQISVGPSGAIYVGSWEKVGPSFRALIAHSDDGGSRWTPLRPAVPLRDGDNDQYLPRLNVAPNGRVDLVYYEITRQSRQDVYWASSDDGAATFHRVRRLTDVGFDATVGPPGVTPRAAGFGPRLASLSFEGSLRAAWTDGRRGTREDGHQDIFSQEQPVDDFATAGSPESGRP